MGHVLTNPMDSMEGFRKEKPCGCTTKVGTAEAFAVWCARGDSVVTWGVNSGGDCSAVQDQLKNVQQIEATNTAFAAILPDRSVVTWGDPRCVGDCPQFKIS